VNKLVIIVQLLMGDIPERAQFRTPVLRRSLAPYYSLTQAVRTGNLALFQQTLQSHIKTFESDRTYTLILRLRHNVIKTGMRKISLSYRRISLADMCAKLGLDSEEEAEFIAAKAVRDGVIDATVDHVQGYLKAQLPGNVFETNEPQEQFDQRIAYCLKLHHDSVKVRFCVSLLFCFFFLEAG
jgi:26S proteasome regulatory subunit N3